MRCLGFRSFHGYHIHKILELVRSLLIAMLLNKKWEILSDLGMKCIT